MCVNGSHNPAKPGLPARQSLFLPARCISSGRGDQMQIAQIRPGVSHRLRYQSDDL